MHLCLVQLKPEKNIVNNHHNHNQSVSVKCIRLLLNLDAKVKTALEFYPKIRQVVKVWVKLIVECDERLKSENTSATLNVTKAFHLKDLLFLEGVQTQSFSDQGNSLSLALQPASCGLPLVEECGKLLERGVGSWSQIAKKENTERKY